MVQVVKKQQPKKGKGSTSLGGRKTKGEDKRRFNAPIVVVITSCGIARSARRLKRNFVPLQEKTSPAPFAHTDGSLGMDSLDE